LILEQLLFFGKKRFFNAETGVFLPKKEKRLIR